MSTSPSLKSARLTNIFLGIIVSALILGLLILGRPILLPVFLALFLTLVLDPPVSFLHRHKFPMWLAVLLTLILVFTLLYLLGWMLYASVQAFVRELPVYQTQFIQSLQNLNEALIRLFGDRINLTDLKNIDWLSTLGDFSLAGKIFSSLGSFLGFVFQALMVLLLIAYMLLAKKDISEKITSSFPAGQADQMTAIIRTVTTQVQKYLSAKTLVSLFTGLSSLIVFLVFGLDFAILWAFIVFLLNFIPNIGSIVASILPVLFSLLQFGSVTVALWLMVLMIVIQLIWGNIVEPKMLGSSMNLSPLMVILGLMFWGYIWGIAGMILAVPMIAAATIITENIPALRFVSVFLRGSNDK
jgi:predicted PurR-regulated permease PerM